MYRNYIDVPETNTVSRVHNVVGISRLQYMEYVISHYKVLCFIWVILVGLLSEVVSQCPVWLFSEVPLCRAVQVYCSDYFLNDSEVDGIASIFTTISISITFVLIFRLRLGLYILKYFRLLSWSHLYHLKLQCLLPGTFLFNYYAFWCLVHC